MASANWLNVNPTAGNGDDSVDVSSLSEHTGREARSTQITFKAANCDDVVRTVKQAGKPEFVSWDDTTASASKEGGTVTISGKTNSSKLTFSLGTNAIGLKLPDTYQANSVDTENGAEVDGDPGADNQYAISLQLDVPANETAKEEATQVIVTDNAGNTSVITINLAAGDPYLRLTDYASDEDVINLDYQGTTVSIAVESNTDWTVE